MHKIISKYKNLLFLIKPWFQQQPLFVSLYYIVNVVLPPLSLYFYTIIPQETFSAISINKSVKDVILILIILALFGIVCDIIPRIFDSILSYKSQNIISKIEHSIYQKALKIDQIQIDSSDFYNSYKMVTESFSKKSEDGLDHSIKTLKALISVILMGAVIFVEGGFILLLVLLFSGCAIFSNILWSSLVTKRNIATIYPSRKIDYVRRLFFDSNYIADLKSSGAKDYIFELLTKSFSENTKIYRSFFKKEVLVALTIVISNIGSVIVVPLYIIIHYFYTGQLDISSFSTLLLASSNLRNGLNEFGWWFSQLNSDLIYASQIADFYTTNALIEDKQNGIVPNKTPFKVEINNLFYQYPNNSDFSLNIDHLEIMPGQRIAIVGDNGAGKSTLFKLLIRLYDTLSGEILYNDLNIKDYNIDLLRQNIGIALQKPVIYAASVKDNLNCLNDTIDVKIQKLLNDFNLNLDLDSNLTKEFDDNGLVLSGGQLQKLSLVRVLLNNNSLLLLDEPSSALDPITELEVTNLIKNISHTTMILIAHRLSIVKDMDYIYVMKGGKIIEKGIHGELMDRRGYYYEMYTSQANSFLDN